MVSSYYLCKDEASEIKFDEGGENYPVKLFWFKQRRRDSVEFSFNGMNCSNTQGGSSSLQRYKHWQEDSGSEAISYILNGIYSLSSVGATPLRQDMAWLVCEVFVSSRWHCSAGCTKGATWNRFQQG